MVVGKICICLSVVGCLVSVIWWVCLVSMYGVGSDMICWVGSSCIFCLRCIM